MKKPTRNSAFIMSRFMALLIIITVSTVAAISPEQKKIFDSKIYDFNAVASSSCQSTQSSPSTRAASTGKLYMIGDSITAGSEEALNQAFTGAGFTPNINGLSSRRLSEGNDPLDGQTILEADMQQNTDAVVVVVALGTNYGLSTDSINTALATIKAAAPNAKIFWVNVGVDNEKRDGSDLTHAVGDNEALDQLKTTGGFTVVDWASAVAAHPEYIGEDGLGVHPNEAGRTAFAQTIVAALSGASTNTGGCGGIVVCQPSEDIEVREKQVWDFFAGKGLTPEAIAGFMGNMAHEASFRPQLVEYGWQNSRGEISQAGEPTSLDEQIPPEQYKAGGRSGTLYVGSRKSDSDQLGGGYGIIQFTSPGRKDHLQQVADRMSAIPGDLCVQLETVWEELNGDYKGSTLDPVMASTDVGTISDIVAKKYEVHGGGEAENAERRASASNYLVKYGSGGGTR